MSSRIYGATTALLLTASLVIGVDAKAQATYCLTPTVLPQQPPPPSPPPICQPKECDKCTKSPCYVATGIYSRDAVDLNIPTAGTLSLTASRVYDSSRVVDGPVGLGWSSSLMPRIYYATYLVAAPSTYSHEADAVMPDGVLYRFTISGSGTFTPPAGRYDKLVLNANGTYSLTLQHTRTVFLFNADGSLASLTDDFGNPLTWTYDSSGRVQRVSDSAGSGRYIDLTWGADGRMSTLTDNSGRQVKYYYDATTGTLTGIGDPTVSGNESLRSTNYTYGTGRFGKVLTKITDRWNRVISALDWYSDGKLKSYTDGAFDDTSTSVGEKYSYIYSTASTTKSHSLGAMTYMYEPAGLVNPPTYINGQPGTVTNPYGGVFQYAYDASGRVTSVTAPSPEPSGNGVVAWLYTYDTMWPEQVASIIPQSKNNWAGWTYDYYDSAAVAPGALWRVWRIRSDATTKDLFATYTYTSHGRLISATDDNGITTASYGYNAAGDLTSVTTFGDPTSTQITHDAVGRPVAVTDPNGHTTTTTYDGLDRPLSVTLPKPYPAAVYDTVTTFSYDNYDSATGLTFTNVTDPNGRVTKSGYDALGHLTQTVDAAGNTTQFTYQHDLLQKIRDANGNETSYAYNAARQMQTTTFPDGAAETYDISSDGVLRSRTDRRGHTLSFSYDGLGRLLSAYYNVTNQFGSHLGYGYSYDGQKLVSLGEQTASANTGRLYTYDSSWRLVTDTDLVSVDQKVTYGYFTTSSQAGSLPTSYTVQPAPGGSGTTQSVTFGYSPSGRVASEAWSWAPGPFTFEYTPTGQYSRINFPNGQQRRFTYDNQDRLTNINNTSPSGDTIASFDYAYDYDWPTSTYSMRGQRTSVNVTAPPSGTNLDLGLTKYSYDSQYQLTRTDYPNNSFEAWTYDAIGNRLSNRVRVGYVFPYTYYTNASGGNTQRLRNDSFSPYDFTYDAAGNMTNANGVANYYSWDVSNRLTAVNDTYAPTAYTYDIFGRATSTLNGSTTRYTTLNSHTIAQRNSGTGVASDYVFGPGIDEPLAKRTANGSITYFAVDGLGSVVATTDAAGTALNYTDYSPWGETNTGTELFGYTGRETGGSLWYNRSRYYDPSHGRFLNEDPLRVFASWSLYSYVDNSPAMFVDPLGLSRQKPDSQYCRALAQKIANIRSAIAKRIRDILDNPRDLPFCDFAGKARDSVFQHMLIVSDLELTLTMRLLQYSRDCGGGPPPLIPVVPSFGGVPNPMAAGSGRVALPIPLPEPVIPALLPLIHPCFLNPGMPGCDPYKRCDTCLPGGT